MSYDLIGQPPRTFFHRLVQVANGCIWDGRGNLIGELSVFTGNTIYSATTIVTGITEYISTGSTVTIIGDSSDTTVLIAGEHIGAGRAVYVGDDGRAYIYQSNNINVFGRFIGLSKGAVLMNEEVQIQMIGIFTDVGFGFVPGVTYYVSENGLPNSTVPTIGFLHCLGVGINANALKLIDNNLLIEL